MKQKSKLHDINSLKKKNLLSILGVEENMTQFESNVKIDQIDAVTNVKDYEQSDCKKKLRLEAQRTKLWESLSKSGALFGFIMNFGLMFYQFQALKNPFSYKH